MTMPAGDAVAAIIANLHDVIIILGFFAFFQWEFSLPVLAAVLASNGISYTFGGATGELVVNGLTPLGLARVVMAVATQFGLQELVYRKLLKGRL